MRDRLALVLLALLIGCAVLGPSLVPHAPLASDVTVALRPPSAAHWLGTDQLGRDIFSRVVVAARLDPMLAVAAVALSAVLGSAIGAAAGLLGGLPDRAVGRGVDVLMAFPLFALAMGLVAALGNSVPALVMATALVNLPVYIRLARAEIRSRRRLGYVEAARAGGSGEARILRVHLLPNILPVLIAQSAVNLGWALLNTAGLSFLGLGLRPPTPDWGIMVAEGAPFILSGHWWIFAGPALALFLAVLTFSLCGEALRDRLDPRR